MKPVMAVIAAAALVLGSSARTASARLNDARVHSLSVIPAAGKADVVIGIAGGVEVRDFTLRGPNRIVLDLAGASLARMPKAYDRVARGGIVDVRYSQFRPDTVRVVLYLDAPHAYQVSRSDKEVRVSVTIPAGVQFAAWHNGRTAAAAVPSTQLVSEQRAAAGEPASGPARRLAEPRAETAATREAARVKAEDASMMNHVVGNRPLAQQGQAVQQRSQQPRISVIFPGSDIRDVIAAFASFSGRTIIPASGITASKVDAEIKDQPWDVALQAILASQGLAATEDANGILIVDTQERIAARAATEQLATVIVRLNYQKATPVAEQIRQRVLQCIPSENNTSSAAAAGQPPVAGPPPAQPSGVQAASQRPVAPAASGGAASETCRGRGTVTADETTNSVSITAPASMIADLRSFAASLDLRQPAVNIKAKIVLVNRTDLDALGIKYDFGSAQQFFSTIIQRVDTAGNVGSANDPPRVLLGGNTVSAIANASGDVPGAALRLIYSTALGNFDFSTFLDALQSVNLLDVQSEPSVTTLNNKTAILTSGVQVPFVPLVSSGGSGTSLTGPVTVERVQTGVTLNVTPSVTNNRQILMHVEVTNADVSFTNNGTLIDNNNVTNDLLVADGQTVVIGGLTQTSVRVTKSGIPLLVDLPLIGRLFGYTTRQEQRRDLLIMITPHIVDEGQVAPETGRP